MSDVTTITIELHGSYAAHHTASGTVINTSDKAYGRRTYKDPIGPLCRILRNNLDYSSETRIHVERAGVSVFKRDLSLAYWADHDVIDTQRRSAVRIEFQPFDHKLTEVFGRQRDEAQQIAA
ncbi:hypothetical protein ASD12_32550 [Mesorhizobium sp. Root102]|uniref:hypothetical protein n=1 Tax=Mesorhizobium sp. Root102 TaxID=1736422 RepID=UPI000701C488|nr:hypothetical protein [Mesorhizobium sp. Root102]KQU80513.1 hypothetical protein ASD12_32550 [Mesorhizobium sp. Root102]